MPSRVIGRGRVAASGGEAPSANSGGTLSAKPVCLSTITNSTGSVAFAVSSLMPTIVKLNHSAWNSEDEEC